ncbi:nudix hydrolase 2-like [Tripterygium wilfordii]|uniref:Nudix hydrolase 2-like n=1 Tax=Tripterygium wilfordii TaxID=458696 RepID=A0A7J7D8Z5_TRIWF|nr:nudix hydrolase 2-like [Tripterygium wilfordii]
MVRSGGIYFVGFRVEFDGASIAHCRQQEGFWYHHAEPKYLVLVCRIPEGISTLPANASYQVSIKHWCICYE